MSKAWHLIMAGWWWVTMWLAIVNALTARGLFEFLAFDVLAIGTASLAVWHFRRYGAP